MIGTAIPTRLLREQFAFLSAGILLFGSVFGGLTAEEPASGASEGFVYAGLIGVPLVFVETFAGRWRPLAATRRWSFAAMILAKSFGYSLWILVGGALAAEVTHFRIIGPVSDLLLHRHYLVTAALLSIAVNAFLAVNRLVGPGVLMRFFSGRYHRPRREHRAFAFVDVKNSTLIAESIGDLRFHGYLNEACSLISRAALYSGGEVHDYVGDQVLVTWPAGPPGRMPGPFVFLDILAEQLRAGQTRFETRYDAGLQLRAAVHAGDVVAGELGEYKQKIAFVGDTMNTAARLEQLARDLDCDAIGTRHALDHFHLPSTWAASSLGVHKLRGKEQPIEVYRLARR